MKLNVFGVLRGEGVHHFLLLQPAVLVHIDHSKRFLVEFGSVLLIFFHLLIGLLRQLLDLFVHLLLHHILHFRSSHGAQHACCHGTCLLCLRNTALLEVVDITVDVMLEEHLTLIRFKDSVSVLVMILECIHCVCLQSLIPFALLLLHFLTSPHDAIEIHISQHALNLLHIRIGRLVQRRKVLVEVRMLTAAATHGVSWQL
mmetsp:Transcript_68333/g.142418  ORF Transcript_68333/g.142418 Transcript_68333/m.142418 type:complete len:201 (+) Transcript_68333:125-727(+)